MISKEKDRRGFLKGIGAGVIGAGLSFSAYLSFVRKQNEENRKIRSEYGIQESGYLEIGGISQYFRIRGEDIRNPIILFLHGGPGAPHSFVSYSYQQYLESEYTFVNWDQRDSGRTYYANRKEIKAEVTVEDLLGDLDEIVDYLRLRFHQEKIIIIGHSWGSVIGSIYIQEKPEKVSAYIGLGQVIDPTGEETAVKRALELAHVDGDKEYIKELDKLFNKFNRARDIREVDKDSLLKIRNLVNIYLHEDEVKGGRKMLWMGLSSPDMNLQDFRWFKKIVLGTKDFIDTQRSLLDYLFFDFDLYDRSRNYEMPVYYLSGTSDWVTPYVSVEDYIEEVKAPDKAFVFVKDAGHNAHVDNPRGFAKALRYLLNRNY